MACRRRSHYQPATLNKKAFHLRLIASIFSLTNPFLLRVSVNAKAETRLDFSPTQAGKMIYKLYFMCDSYLGADQEFDVNSWVRVEEHSQPSQNHERDGGKGRGERKRRHDD